ncbi:FtsX-like permease family protein [Clostridium brassicae]|uniref:ABC transporter permease n=1 Tax=Clostridium brassicae TaxID=2999072 RepID=A0ABT4DCS3_9CLOT|nr:FtsX-like permease family protein [Clostridium brassicae]MCY6960115.1 ABC transporter permease [Clostridium brassicae]
MKKTFFKNLFRDIKKSLSRFLSIVIIIAIGVAFYAGVRATSPDMKMSADYYFSKNNFMDFKLISTLGLTKNDLAELQKQSGVTQAEGSYSIDAVVEKNKQELVLNINSLPEEKGINNIRTIRGRRPEKADEAVVEEKFFEKNKLKLGDKILIKSGNDTNIEDSLKNTEFKIVGTAESPIYVSEQRQLSSVGNGTVRGFVYILSEVFKSEVYTEIYARTDNEFSKNSLLNNESYKENTDTIEKDLKNLGVLRNEIRYAEVLKEGRDKIAEAQGKLDSSKKEAAQKFADGYNKLDDARDKILKGKEELRKNELLFNQKIEESTKQIEDGKKQILSGENEIKVKKKELENAKLQLGEGNMQLQESEAKLNKAIIEFEARKKQIAESEVQLNKKRQEGLEKFNSGRKELQEAQKEIDKNTEKLKSEEEKANAKFAEGEAEIQKSRDKLNDIKKPDWYVLGRTQNVGYESYRQDSDRIDNIGKAFPLIFFLVASLVSLTTMTRMVQDKRIKIGTFKALGYSRGAIVSHYLIYALSASAIGSIIGVSIGFRLFPPFIMNAYSSLYAIPESVTPFNTSLALQASLVAVFFTAIAAVASTLEELREVPASLMRPKPPKSGKKIFLERVDFIWKRLNFTKKVTARNIFRYKQRLFMTVIGIAACTGLMITGFGLKEGVIGATEAQFGEIYKYDMQATLNKNVNETSKKDIKIKALKDSNVKSILFTYSKNGSVKSENSKSQDAYVVVPEDKDAFNSYVKLTMKGEKLSLDDDGVILTKKLSKLINKKAGDTVEITLNDKVIKAKISAVTEHYIQHYIYMSPNLYKKITGSNVTFNSFYGLLNNKSEAMKNNTLNTLKGISSVNSVVFKNNVQVDFNKSVDTMNTVVLLLIVSAGVLAFVVIYNLTNINITERRRELATIKLLGFYDSELAAYIYRENIILTMLGSLTGIFVGIILNKFITSTAETNVIMFLQKISPIYFVYSILLTLLFSVVVNLAMYKRFDKIDMIESLKSAE